LGVTNPNLASGLTFSTGGFSAQYGDKLSSVLDVEYKQPTRFRGSAELGLLTQNLHLEGANRSQADSTQPGAFSFLVGARRFSTTYLLGSLDTQGNYEPEFFDIQSEFAYAPRSKKPIQREKTRKNGETDTIYSATNRFRISLLTIAARNRYTFFPQSRETVFGQFPVAKKLFIGYIGSERTSYLTGQTALTLDWRPNLRVRVRHILSGVSSEESELISTEGGYRLSDIETNLGSDDFGKEVFVRGVGSEIREARNYLSVRKVSFQQLGEVWLDRNFYKLQCDTCYAKHLLKWGLRGQYESIDDEIREWFAVDSAEFITIRDRLSARNIVNSVRLNGFLQHNWQPGRSLMLITGVRVSYWSYNEQLLVSPRVQLVWKPMQKREDGRQVPFSERTLLFRFAVGSYDQPPFYRELRSYQGVVFPETRAQRSVHLIAGMDYQLKIWNRPFTLFAEAYGKYLYDIVPYEIENVRIRYYPDEVSDNLRARGYAYGLDARLSGQFLEGIDSWISMSVMNTREDLDSDNRGWVRRPTDQRFQVSLFFQDYVPKVPWLRMNMTLIYNTGLPFGPPGMLDNRTVFQNPAYFRVDFGANALLRFREKRPGKFGFESVWVGLEIFNLFARENVVSNLWVKDIFETVYAVPNYLSNRLVNGRIIVRF
jgi:hypothetical protein